MMVFFFGLNAKELAPEFCMTSPNPALPHTHTYTLQGTWIFFFSYDLLKAKVT